MNVNHATTVHAVTESPRTPHAQIGSLLPFAGGLISSAKANSSPASPFSNATTVVVTRSGGWGAAAPETWPSIVHPQAGQINCPCGVSGPGACWAWHLGQRMFDGGMVSPAHGPGRTGSRRDETAVTERSASDLRPSDAPVNAIVAPSMGSPTIERIPAKRYLPPVREVLGERGCLPPGLPPLVRPPDSARQERKRHHGRVPPRRQRWWPVIPRIPSTAVAVTLVLAGTSGPCGDACGRFPEARNASVGEERGGGREGAGGWRRRLPRPRVVARQVSVGMGRVQVAWTPPRRSGPQRPPRGGRTAVWQDGGETDCL